MQVVPSRTVLLEEIRTFIPKLSYNVYKGAAGKIGVFGGSLEYTGAPFFAAITCLRTGNGAPHPSNALIPFILLILLPSNI